jgi:hypothetical protein
MNMNTFFSIATVLLLLLMPPLLLSFLLLLSLLLMLLLQVLLSEVLHISLYMTNEGANGHRKSCNLVTLHLSSRALFVLRITSRVSFIHGRRGFSLLEGTYYFLSTRSSGS